MKTSLIIPAYNEEKTIKEIIEKSSEYADEIIIVDGASTDNTYSIIKNINDKKIKIIRQKEKKGVIQARIDGLEKAENDIIIFMDADAQHNPEDIPKFLKKIDQCDLVLGAREEKVPRLGERIMAYVCKVKDPVIGFKVFKKNKLKEIIQKEKYWGADTILRARIQGLKICEVPIEVNERKHGRSKLSDIKVFLKSLVFLIKHIFTEINSSSQNKINPIKLKSKKEINQFLEKDSFIVEAKKKREKAKEFIDKK